MIAFTPQIQSSEFQGEEEIVLRLGWWNNVVAGLFAISPART
jgi:hypothetical protein